MQTIVTKNIEDSKLLLMDKWYSRIKTLLLKGTKKKHVPEVSKVKIITRFYDSVSALMSQNLSDITIRTLKRFTDVLCNFEVSASITSAKSEPINDSNLCKRSIFLLCMISSILVVYQFLNKFHRHPMLAFV